MGKLIGSGHMGFATFLFFFAISVALDFEYDVFTMDGGGEALGQSRILEGDILVRPNETIIPIKLLDVVTLALLAIFLFNRKSRIFVIKNAVDKKAWWSLVAAASFFYLWGGASILINAHEYTKPQVMLMALHLVKLMQVTLVGVMVALLVRGRDISEISRPLLLGILFACVVLILNKLGYIAIGAVAGDRMETFGGVIIAIAMIFYFHHMEVRNGEISSIKKLLYVATVFVASVAILTSGKRGVELAFLVCLVPLLSSGIFIKTVSSRKLQLAVLAGLIVSLPNIMNDFGRSIGQPYNALHSTEFRGDIVGAYVHFKNIFEPAVDSTATDREEDTAAHDREEDTAAHDREEDTAAHDREEDTAAHDREEDTAAHDREVYELIKQEISLPLVSFLDHSGADRIGRIIKTITLSAENMWLGSGFFGVQYKYGFLPDTGLQVLLETGLIGVSLLLAIMYLIWHGTATGHDCIRRASHFYLLVTLVALVVLSMFCNPFYMKRLVLIFMFFSTLLVAAHFPNNENKTNQ